MDTIKNDIRISSVISFSEEAGIIDLGVRRDINAGVIDELLNL